MPIVDTEISNLNPIPSSWSELEVENFIKNRCKFPAADPDVDTYNCSYSELFKYANSAINQNSTSIAGALSMQQKMLGGVTSIWYVDADNGLDTNDGKSIAYSFKTLDKALSSVSACNLIFITSSTAITYSIASDVTLPNNTYIISNSPLVNISLSSVSFGTDSAIYIKGSLTIGNINLSSKLILSSRDLTLTSTHIGSNANIILAADTVTLGCTINGKVSVKSSSLYLVNNVILSDSYINVSFLYLGTSGYSYVTGSCHIRCDTVYNTPKENGSLIVTSGKLYVNINRVESSSTATWLMCTTILGNTASVVGFIGEEVDSNISYSGLGVADIRVTYAGEKYSSVIYDAVCSTQEDLQEAINDSSVHSVYLRYPLTALGTPTTYKYFYGETILWNISTVNLIKFYNVCTLLDNVTFDTVYFSDVNASVSKTVTASTLGYYERRSNIECINVSQKYWNTSVPNASYTEKGVVKLNSDFLIEDDGTISLSSKSLAKRFVYGTYTSPSYFIGQGTVSENYGTTTLTCTSAGIIKIGSDIDFLILTINISSTHTTSNELQWFESQIQIGYWSNSTFTVVKTLSKEHTNDSGSIDDSFSYVIDVSKIIGNELGIKYISNYDIDSSSYSVCLVQTGTSVNGSGEAAVVHDATLTGDGTAASPLSVVGGGTGGGDSRGILPTMDSEGYYHIYTLAQMLWVNNSLANLPEKNYKLMNDIVCNSDYSDYLSWETTPPMNEMLAAKGGCIQANYFDGNGHTIYGMYSYNVSANDAAFFGIWASGTRPTIKNVRMKNCTAIGNTTAEAIITNGTYSNICVESCLFKNLSKNAWSGSSIIEAPSYYGASIVSNVYSINCTLKGGNGYYHSGLFIGQVAGDGGSATSEFFNCYENQTESIVDSFAGGFAYPVNGKNLYKQSGASWNVGGTFNLTDCAEKSTAEMKSQAFCDLLNSNASASSYPATWSYSEGMFPYLYNWTQE